jgi:hypothetical protein
MKAVQAQIKQQLAPLISDQDSWLGRDTREMVASIDRKIADFDAHRQGAIADRRQMDAQIARAKAVEDEMQSLGERIQTRVREFKETQAKWFDQAVRADLRNTQGMIADGRYTITGSARERARVLANATVPNLDAKKQAYLDAKRRGAPQAEIDRALDAYHGATVDGFNFVRQSGQAEGAALQNRIKNLERALGAVRFIRDGSFAVGAMLIPGAQGVGLGSAAAAVGALGLMKTGTHLLDEKPGGGRWTPGSAGKALVTNTAGLGVDAIGGAGYLKLGKEMMFATNAIRKGRLIGEAGALGTLNGTAHRLIQGQGKEALDPKKLAVDGAISATTFGLNSKLAPAMLNMNPLARYTANTVLGGATGGGAQVVSNVVEGRPIGDNVDVATIQGAGTGLVSSIAMSNAMPDLAYVRALRPRIQEAVAAYQAGDYQKVRQLLTDAKFAAKIGLRLDVKTIIINEEPRQLSQQEIDSFTTMARLYSWSSLDRKKAELVAFDAFLVPKDGSAPTTWGDVPALSKQLTPIMLEEWMHQMQNASGRPISKLTSQYLKENGLKWSPEYYEMDIIASFYEWGFPVGDIGTANVYAERRAFQDWYRSRRDH